MRATLADKPTGGSLRSGGDGICLVGVATRGGG